VQTKVISFVVTFLLSVGLLALSGWYVQRIDIVRDNSNPITPVVQGDEQNTNQEADVPETDLNPVQRGLRFLAKNQFEDGHWEGDNGQHPVAMTGLVGLALLMEGSTVREGQYSANVSKAVDWLMANSPRDGLIFSEHPSETARYMEGHGLATLFLAGARQRAYGDARAKKLDDTLSRAVKYIARAQSSQGGWHHTSRMEGHDFAAILVTAIQLQALQAAENARVDVPLGVVHDGQEYLRITLEKDLERTGHNRDRTAEIAAALACRFRHEALIAKDEPSKLWFKHCRTEIPLRPEIEFGRVELMHYYYAQAVFSLGEDWEKISERESGVDRLSWKGYRAALFNQLQNSQTKDGSWPAGNGIGVGRVYSTAVWCTILQLDSQRHPSTEVRMKPKF